MVEKQCLELMNMSNTVIPAKAGIQLVEFNQDSGFPPSRE
jgi:hypothetical protein